MARQDRRKRKKRHGRRAAAAEAEREGTGRALDSRGSAEPMAGRCGSPLRGSCVVEDDGTERWRYCTQWPAKGRERCKLHGGTAKRGPASAAYRTGNRSKFHLAIKRVLGGAVDDDRSNADMMDLSSDLRFLEAQQVTALEEMADGRTAEAWAAAVVAFGELERAIGAQDVAALQAARKRLGELLQTGGEADAARDRVVSLAQTKARVVEKALRVHEFAGNFLTAAQAIEFARRLVTIIEDEVVDPAVRSRIQERVSEEIGLVEGGIGVRQ